MRAFPFDFRAAIVGPEKTPCFRFDILAEDDARPDGEVLQ